MNSIVSTSALNECQKMAGKSLIEMFMSISHEPDFTITENKQDALDWANNELDTNYNINHLNNWIAGRKPTPKRVQSMMRESVIDYLFGNDVAEMLSGLN